MFLSLLPLPLACVFTVSLLGGLSSLADGQETDRWTVPLAGNVYRTAPGPGGPSFSRNGAVSIREPGEVYSAYVHFDRPAKIQLSLVGKSTTGPATLSVRAGQQTHTAAFATDQTKPVVVGDFEVQQPGYVQFDFQNVSESAKHAAELSRIVIQSSTEKLALDFVRNNDGNMFYWGRRGPSVHLGYPIPKDVNVQYAYSEVTVPEGEDPLGSYYMAIGFAEGYFGIQVNGPDERRVLFSVWSPFSTDNPRDIPEDQRVEALAKGAGVTVGEFGNEGSGGQSYWIYPWTAGKTYRFLVEVIPNGDNKTTYTAWFSEKGAEQWQLVASFRRPKTNTSLRGFHSFLESFSPTHGHIGRKAFYGNQWVCDSGGQWLECTEARFTVDATGSGRHRLDFTGGAEGEVFYLKNCGFFSEPVKPGTIFKRVSSTNQQPRINLASLPR